MAVAGVLSAVMCGVTMIMLLLEGIILLATYRSGLRGVRRAVDAARRGTPVWQSRRLVSNWRESLSQQRCSLLEAQACRFLLSCVWRGGPVTNCQFPANLDPRKAICILADFFKKSLLWSRENPA